MTLQELNLPQAKYLLATKWRY